MQITTIGVDLAKNVFQVHGVDQHGKTALKKQIRRDQMVTFFANLSPCMIGIGAIVESGVRGVGKRQEKAVAIEGECCFSR